MNYKELRNKYAKELSAIQNEILILKDCKRAEMQKAMQAMEVEKEEHVMILIAIDNMLEGGHE